MLKFWKMGLPCVPMEQSSHHAEYILQLHGFVHVLQLLQVDHTERSEWSASFCASSDVETVIWWSNSHNFQEPKDFDALDNVEAFPALCHYFGNAAAHKLRSCTRDDACVLAYPATIILVMAIFGSFWLV